MDKKYTADDFIRIAKRENNKKRAFLYVNPLQGKHVPVSPAMSIKVFKQLAKKVEKTYPNEKLLIIGFAETATAIGNAIAFFESNVSAFMTTTRENAEGTDFLFFTESHSHASEQRLAVNGLEYWLKNTDRVVFAEDEVTTGNTIAKLISALTERFSDINLKFGIVSILNSMPLENAKSFLSRGINCTYLVRIPFGYRINDVDNYVYDSLTEKTESPKNLCPLKIEITENWNQRFASDTDTMKKMCKDFILQAVNIIELSEQSLDILVLGTEEFMFVGLIFAAKLEKYGHKVYYHATTRSPIEVSSEEFYPLHQRFSLISLYDSGRKTFVYNLRKYDKVFIVTDAPTVCEDGLDSLVGALEKCGNKDVTFIKWGECN